MKHALLSFALIFATPAMATPEDDLAACVIGKAAVTLHNQKTKDTGAALQEAYEQCPEPAGFNYDQMDDVGYYVNVVIQAIGEGVYAVPAEPREPPEH